MPGLYPIPARAGGPMGSVCYTSLMTKKITLEQKIDALTGIVEKGFTAIADDIARLATKDQVAALHTQVNVIEQGRYSRRRFPLDCGRVGASQRGHRTGGRTGDGLAFVMLDGTPDPM
jgi:hypothetical protein